MDENFKFDKETVRLLSRQLDAQAVQKLYLFNYLTDQKDFNFTNLLFQVNSQGKIIPIAIDFEKAYSFFSSAVNGEMYDNIFKEAIDLPLSSKLLESTQKITSQGNLQDLANQWKKDEQSVVKGNILQERVELLKNIIQETQGNFSIFQLYKKANVPLN